MPRLKTPTILVLENDDNVRQFIVTTLRAARRKYNVVEASTTLQGIAAMLSIPKKISLAIVDILMSRAGTLDFAVQLAIEHPTTPILYISELEHKADGQTISLRAQEYILYKPFTAVELLQHVR